MAKASPFPLIRFARPFTRERLLALLSVCDDLDRTLELPGGDVPERLFMRAYFQALHDTGMSPRQLLALRWEAIQPSGQIPVEFVLGRETMLAVSRIASVSRPNVFALPAGYDFTDRLGLIRKFASLDESPDANGGKDGA